jgi:hypothetical protein
MLTTLSVSQTQRTIISNADIVLRPFLTERTWLDMRRNVWIIQLQPQRKESKGELVEKKMMKRMILEGGRSRIP